MEAGLVRPYGSKKRTHYDTEPVIKAARAVEKERGRALVDEQHASACVDDSGEPCCEIV
jgi:hypothetical protein